MRDSVALMNWAALLGFLVLTLVLYRSVPFRYLTLHLVMAQTWALVSCLYLTMGQYTFELNLNTHQNLAPLTLAFYNSVFFVAVWTVLRTLPGPPPGETGLPPSRPGGWRELAVLAVCCLALAHLYSLFLSEGIPLFTGESRQEFLYRVILATPSGRLIAGNIGVMALALGTIMGREFRSIEKTGRRIRNAAGGLMTLLIMHQVLAGNKFSSLFWVSFLFVVPIGILVRFRPGVGRRLVGAAAIALAVFGVYRLAQRAYATDLHVSVASRVLVLQGELWWAVHDRVFTEQRGDAGQLRAELAAVIEPGSARVTGLRYLMERYGDPSIVILMQLAGFTGGYPGIVLDTVGPLWAIAIQVLMGLVFGFTAFLIFRYVRRGEYIQLVVAGTLFSLANSTFVMGDFTTLFKAGSIAKLTLLAGLELYVLLAARAGIAGPVAHQRLLLAPGNRPST